MSLLSAATTAMAGPGMWVPLFIDDNIDKGVKVTWRAHGNLLFQNWLNYYVYQYTPFDIDNIQ